MQATEARVRQAAKFSALDLAPRPIPNTNFQIRLPAAFLPPKGFFYTPESADPFGTPDNIKISLLQPPFLNLPGIRAILQSMASDDRGGRYPWFCYLAAVTDADWKTESVQMQVAEAREQRVAAEKKANAENLEKMKAEGEQKPEGEAKPEGEPKPEAPSGGEAPKADAAAPPAAGGEPSPQPSADAPTFEPIPLLEYVVQKLSTTFPGKPLAWEDVQAETPSGGESKTWKRLSVVGDQPFQFIGSATSDALEKVPGRFELYLYQSDGWNVLVGWRAPTAVETKVSIERLAALAAGTIQP